jgi:hypothetical protein
MVGYFLTSPKDRIPVFHLYAAFAKAACPVPGKNTAKTEYATPERVAGATSHRLSGPKNRQHPAPAMNIRRNNKGKIAQPPSPSRPRDFAASSRGGLAPSHSGVIEV